VMLPLTEKLRIPDFCNAKKSANITRPIGSACQISQLFSELSSCFSWESSYPCSDSRGDNLAIFSSIVSSFLQSHVNVCFLICTCPTIPSCSWTISSISILHEGQWSHFIW
jgi:hypothetical protein